MTRNFIFDLDGTLVDSLPGIEYAINAALLPTYPRMCADDLRSLIGPPIRSILHGITAATGEELIRLERHFRRAYDTHGWRKTACYPGVHEMLSSLKEQKKRLFVVTNKPRVAAEKILKMLSLRNYVEDSVTPDSRAPAFQSKAGMLRWLMKRKDLDAHESLMVGDTLDDYKAAAELGVSTVLVTHGYGGAPVSGGILNCRWIAGFSQITSDYLYNRGTA
jgi:phosphoglycolate phosphatase